MLRTGILARRCGGIWGCATSLEWKLNLVGSALGSCSMGCYFESHRGHWWCQERHNYDHNCSCAPMTIQPHDPLKKNPNLRLSQAIET